MSHKFIGLFPELVLKWNFAFLLIPTPLSFPPTNTLEEKTYFGRFSKVVGEEMLGYDLITNTFTFSSLSSFSL